ncbi:hypothetical protein D2V93_05925 [Flagellimonas taeanensis]|jgi:predicted RNase H-like nuclease (RuvC/YqgF family)|uniref:hypothetical protein n=1 Tax=Flavobacteriaceae TaxID=49546 RepID=UPI000E680DEA|nr:MULTISPECIES: hypothetical protein [Allomuricauda]MDC6384503.1 hypothetical protein [Muricauda sp. SK9]RIV52182.1 hypothetical protein D2V93_05925 [Allomuricauda taeanensis]
MAHDLRKMFEKEREQKSYSMKDGHEARFLEKLDGQLPAGPRKKKVYTLWLQIAASVIVAVGLSMYFMNSTDKGDLSDENVIVADRDKTDGQEQTISLGDLSPDFKKIETYYTTNINLQLSDLEMTSDNKELMDSYLERLAELNEEYQQLNKELNELGPNDQTISALIMNLQLRLQLLQKLKTKLNQLKSSKNEQESSHII